MYDTYIPNQKSHSIRISVLWDITKLWKKSATSKMTRTFILHNNNAEVIQKIVKKIVQ